MAACWPARERETAEIYVVVVSEFHSRSTDQRPLLVIQQTVKKDSALINIHTCRETFRLLLLLEVLRPNFFREGGGGAEDSDAIVCYANRPHGVAPN